MPEHSDHSSGISELDWERSHSEIQENEINKCFSICLIHIFTSQLSLSPNTFSGYSYTDLFSPIEMHSKMYVFFPLAI